MFGQIDFDSKTFFVGKEIILPTQQQVTLVKYGDSWYGVYKPTGSVYSYNFYTNNWENSPIPFSLSAQILQSQGSSISYYGPHTTVGIPATKAIQSTKYSLSMSNTKVPMSYTAVMPPSGMIYIYEIETGNRLTVSKSDLAKYGLEEEAIKAGIVGLGSIPIYIYGIGIGAVIFLLLLRR